LRDPNDLAWFALVFRQMMSLYAAQANRANASKLHRRAGAACRLPPLAWESRWPLRHDRPHSTGRRNCRLGWPSGGEPRQN
jgi:hypothetical protein